MADRDRREHERPGSTPGSDQTDLLLLSGLLLFFELVLIRWISSSIRIVAYFSNIVLVSCFLGFGVGCLLKKRRDLLPFFPWSALVLVALGRYLSRAGVKNPDQATEYFFGGGGTLHLLLVVPLIFLVTALTFACLGQGLAKKLDRFPPLRGYTINVAGSLLGTMLLGVLSFSQARPSVWFGLCAVPMIWLLRDRRRAMLLGGLAMVTLVAVVHDQQKSSLWSPYNKIELSRIPPAGAGAFRLVANDDYHQLTLNLSPEWIQRESQLKDWEATYDLPYRALSNPPGKVLVLGAGTGNDVAAALRHGAKSVNAVEIDPLILRLGRRLHPNQPYGDPRVQVTVNDARAYLRGNREQFDIIVLGWLDSHRLFSSLSNIRQDNFVYTLESLRLMRSQLTADGLLSLSFYVGKPWIGKKIFDMTREAFGHEPVVFAFASGAYGRDGQSFLIRPDPGAPLPQSLPGFVNLTEEYRRMAPVPYPTDDWPYLYYQDRRLHTDYLAILAILLGISLLIVFAALPRGQLMPRNDAPLFFFLGAAFLLLEVRNITVLALVYGSTWVVTSVVIMMVLLMVLLANWLTARWGSRLRGPWVWTGLCISIILSLVWDESVLPFTSPAIRGMTTTLVVSLTFLFAGIIFARSFSRTLVPSTALGFNVLGAVFGGLLEYLSLVYGVRALSGLALALYLAALLCDSRFVVRADDDPAGAV